VDVVMMRARRDNCPSRRPSGLGRNPAAVDLSPRELDGDGVLRDPTRFVPDRPSVAWSTVPH